MEPKYVIALEAGSSKIKGAVGVVDASGSLTVLAVEQERLVDCVRYGMIRNVEEVSNRVMRIIGKLERHITPNKIEAAYVAIGGLSTGAMAREVSRHFAREVEFTEQLRSELIAEAAAFAMSNREIVDVAERMYRFDDTTSSRPVGSYGTDIKGEFTLVTCSPKLTNMLNLALDKRGRIKNAGLIVRQVAEADLVLTPEEKELGCVFVDFGAETTTVSVYKNGYLNHLTTVPLGSRSITRDIATLNHAEEEAENLKIIGGNASATRSDDGMYDEMNLYVGARAGEIIANVYEQIKASGLSATQLPKGIVVVGGGARLRGFKKRLESETRMPVREGLLPANLHINDTRIDRYDNIDVISILAAAVNKGAVSCTSAPEPVRQSVAETQSAPTSTYHPPYSTGNDSRYGADTQAPAATAQRSESLHDNQGGTYESGTDLEPERNKKTPKPNKFAAFMRRLISDETDYEFDN